MSNLIHLFSVGQKVRCNMDGTFYKGIVTETHTDHIIIDIPEVSNHCGLKMISISRMFTRNIISNQLRR